MVILLEDYRRSIYNSIKHNRLDRENVVVYNIKVDSNITEDISKILEIVQAINKFELRTWEEVDNELVGIGFSTLKIIDIFMEELSTIGTSKQLFSIMKDLFYKTRNKENFKLAIEIIGLNYTEDMAKDFFLVGKDPEYAIHVCRGFSCRNNYRMYKKYKMDLLPLTKNISTIYLVESLLQEELSLEEECRILEHCIWNVKNRRGITCLLLDKLNLEAIFKVGVENSKLQKAIIYLFEDGMFCKEQGESMLCLNDSIELLNKYIDFLDKTIEKELTFFALINLKIFLDLIHGTVKIQVLKEKVQRNIKMIKFN